MKFFLWALLAAHATLLTPPSTAAEWSAEQSLVVEGRQPSINRTVLRRADVPGTHYEVIYTLVTIAAHSVVAKQVRVSIGTCATRNPSDFVALKRILKVIKV
jgi:hypothetical protein